MTDTTLDTMTDLLRLTEDQLTFLTRLDRFLSVGNTSTISLSGSAGTGKSFVTIEAVKRIMAVNENAVIGMIAPINKAVNVIAQMLESAELSYKRQTPYKKEKESGESEVKPGVYIGTIHQFLGANPDSRVCGACEHSSSNGMRRLNCMQHNGKHVLATDTCPEFRADDDKPAFNYKPKTERPLSICNYVLVDEASMVNKEQVELINDSLGFDTLLIYIGDEFQFFPVDDDTLSPSFDQKTAIKLNEIVRYTGDILRVAADIKDKMISENTVRPYGFPGRRDTKTQDVVLTRAKKNLRLQSDFFKRCLTLVPEAIADKNDSLVRCLVYRNRTAEETNNMIRIKIYGGRSINQFYPGEWFFSTGAIYTHIDPILAINGLDDGQKEELAEFNVRFDKVDLRNPTEEYIEAYAAMQSAGLSSFYGIPNGIDLFCDYSETRTFKFPVPKEYQSLEGLFPQLEQSYELLTFTRPNGIVIKLVTFAMSQHEELAGNLDKLSKFGIYASAEHSIPHAHMNKYLSKVRKALKYIEKPVTMGYQDDYDSALTYQFLSDFHRPINIGQLQGKRVFNKLTVGSCITLRRSQGSSIDHVFFDYSDVMASVMYRKSDSLESRLDQLHRATYTGVTRAKKTLNVFSTGSEYTDFS